MKIIIVDGIRNKVIEKDITLRNELHFNTQLKHTHKVYKDKTKYTRKQKHRNRDYD